MADYSSNRSQIVLHRGPAVLSDAQAAYYQVTLVNRSGELWSSDSLNPVHLCYRWYNEQGQLVNPDGLRTRLPRPIEHGEQATAHVRVSPPVVPGRYTLEIDLVREGVAWLDLCQRAPVEVQIETRPRAVIININCLANDAVGIHVRRKLRLLQLWGYAPLLLAEYIDDRLGLEDQALMVACHAGQIMYPDPNGEWVAQHFWNSSLAIFNYPVHYELVELIRAVSSGIVVFDYHGVTPPDLWASAVDRVSIERGVANVNLVGYADYAIAHSEFTRAELLATGLVPPTRTQVIPYAVAFDLPTTIDLPTPPEVAGRSPVLLYVGRMAGNKRIDTLIDMAARVREHYPDMRLLLVGDDQTPSYQSVVAAAHRQIAELGLEDHIVFTGAKNHHELPRYYQACDVYVTSSLHEGFCIPVVEAMAYSRPVVATNATALPSTVGDAGLLFEPGDVEGFAAQVLALLASRPQAVVS